MINFLKSNILLILVSGLLLSACNSSKKKPSNTNVSKQKIEILHYQKTSCYGRCPAYVFKLYEDLTCDLDAQLFFIVEGKNTGKMDKKDFDELILKIKAANLFELNEVYNDTLVHDIPSTYIRVNLDGKSKKIKSVINAPKNLLQLQSEIEFYIQKITWSKSEN